MRPASLLALALAAACSASPPPARAAGSVVDDDGACYADLARLCSDQPRGVRERVGCLLQSRDALSPECSAAIAGIEAARDEQAEAAQGVCRDDVARLCPDAEASTGDVTGCLQGHGDAVSEACRAAIGGQAP